MKALKLSLLAATATIVFAGAAQAADRPLGLTFNVGAATDYVFRGISQTQEDPQLFGGADVALGKIGYAGVWVSNVDFGDDTDMEYDLYAGIKPVVGPVTLDLGVIRYGYHNQPSSPKWTYYEWKAAGSFAAGPATLGAAAYYSDDETGEIGPGVYYEVNAASPIPNTKFSVSGAVGKQHLNRAADYATWNVGVGYALTDHVGLDLRYWDTDAHDFGKIYDSRVVLGVKATF